MDWTSRISIISGFLTSVEWVFIQSKIVCILFETRSIRSVTTKKKVQKPRDRCGHVNQKPFVHMSIFSRVKYHLSPSLPPELQSNLSYALEANGATKVALGKATHIITDSNQFEGWQTVQDGVAVVTVRNCMISRYTN